MWSIRTLKTNALLIILLKNTNWLTLRLKLLRSLSGQQIQTGMNWPPRLPGFGLFQLVSLITAKLTTNYLKKE
jgi:hypothetical protein